MSLVADYGVIVGLIEASACAEALHAGSFHDTVREPTATFVK
jgi:hypothetical protein